MQSVFKITKTNINYYTKGLQHDISGYDLLKKKNNSKKTHTISESSHKNKGMFEIHLIFY